MKQHKTMYIVKKLKYFIHKIEYADKNQQQWRKYQTSTVKNSTKKSRKSGKATDGKR